MKRTESYLGYLVTLASIFCFSGCLIEPIDNENITEISYTKVEAELESSFVNGQKISNVYVKLYKMKYNDAFHYWKIDSNIDTLENGSLKINGINMVYGSKNNKTCFYPQTKVELLTDTIYHIILKIDTEEYDSYIKMPITFDKLDIKDTLNTSTGILFNWNNSFPPGVFTYIDITNPKKTSENYVILNDNMYSQNGFKIPMTLLPFIDGWKGSVRLLNEKEGRCTPKLNPNSFIKATSEYKDQFIVKNIKS
jgi:hypothetical protein